MNGMTRLLKLLVIIMCCGTPGSSYASASEDTAHVFRVVSYNIKHGQGMDGKVDIERIARVLAEQKPDLVALQEIDKNCARSGNRDLAAELGRSLGMEHRFGKAIDLQEGEYGVAVLSKFPILDTRLHPLPGGGEPRVALEVVVDVFGHRLSLVSLHLEWSQESIRIRQVKALVDALAPREHPVMVAGDFNATRERAPMQFLVKEGWDILKKTAATERPGIPGDPPREFRTTARSEIDFIVLHAFPGTAVRHEVVDELTASDHRPIFAELRLLPVKEP